MSFAPTSVYFNTGDGSILGSFNEKEFGVFFEFSTNNETEGYGGSVKDQFPHKVWVRDGFRYANVKKTVAYVAVDENDDGVIVEKWSIKNLNKYERP